VLTCQPSVAGIAAVPVVGILPTTGRRSGVDGATLTQPRERSGQVIAPQALQSEPPLIHHLGTSRNELVIGDSESGVVMA
jgi:hypothetical protein